MKKFFGITLIAGLLAFLLFSNDVSAQKGKGNNQNKHNCSKFIDANGDGICDNFIDANGDGKCDNCTVKGNCDNTCMGNGQGKHNCSKFIDVNGDGKCDNFVDANGDGKCDNCIGNGSCDSSGKGMGNCNGKGMGNGNGMGNGKSKGNCGNGCGMTKNTTSTFTLNQNIPNPVIGNTTISFNLKEANNVKIILSDKLGNKVKDIFEGNLSIGDHEVDFNASGLNPGNYFYSVYVAGKVQTKQIVVIK